MKKMNYFRQATITAILMLAVVLSAKSQTFQGLGLSLNNNCGTWKALPIYYTNWESMDTLKKKNIKDTIRKWVYDEERLQFSNTTTLEYNPCGSGKPIIWEQYRVCQITGIRQRRYKIQPYEYIPKTKSDYERTVDSLSKNNR
jgi:hypothetical protein